MTLQAVMREAVNLDSIRSLPPQVKEMLTDPIVCALMLADNVDPHALEALLCAVAYRLRAPALKKENEMSECADTVSAEHVLLNEINHRINNEFAAAISVISLAAARNGSNEVKTALAGVTELLHDCADVHRALQMPEHDEVIDAAAYLRNLCSALSRSKLACRTIKLVLEIQPLRLHADRCWRLGMIINELMTNAARHAFRDDGGEIRMVVLRTGAFVKCAVSDSGSAIARSRRGRGLKIVDGLVKTLNGRFEQSFGPRGSISMLIFPCDGNWPGSAMNRSARMAASAAVIAGKATPRARFGPASQPR
jgi:two-component sensor histidine kinase